jgi:lysophospholipase L1-like esterase
MKFPSFVLFLSLGILASCTKPGLENQNPGLIILDGDSRTDGWNCSYCYPYMDLLKISDSCRIIKISEGGNTTDSLLSRAWDRIDPGLIDSAGFKVVVVWAGVNDIAVHKKSASTVFDNLVNYCQSRRMAGWKVIICTEVSMKGTGTFGRCDQTRMRLNDRIRQEWKGFSDGLADLGGKPVIGAESAYLDTRYFCDGIHLTNLGTDAVAEVINQSINDLIDRLHRGK